jgi:hypothetical protein
MYRNLRNLNSRILVSTQIFFPEESQNQYNRPFFLIIVDIFLEVVNHIFNKLRT